MDVDGCSGYLSISVLYKLCLLYILYGLSDLIESLCEIYIAFKTFTRGRHGASTVLTATPTESTPRNRSPKFVSRRPIHLTNTNIKTNL